MGTLVHQVGLNQAITYWAPAGNDGFGGQTFDTPAALTGRFEEKTELFINEQGQEERCSGVFFLSADVALGGYLYQGASEAADPTTLDDAWRVKDFKKIPRLGNETQYLRRARV